MCCSRSRSSLTAPSPSPGPSSPPSDRKLRSAPAASAGCCSQGWPMSGYASATTGSAPPCSCPHARCGGRY
eukprot:432427-Rhodomonas_salina.2